VTAEIFGGVGAEAVLFDLRHDPRAGLPDVLEVRVDIVDVGPRHVRDGAVSVRLPFETEQDHGDVAVVELDPVEPLGRARDTGPGPELEHPL